MPTTSRGYRYPAGSAAPNVPVDMANLASDLNTDVGAVAKTGTIVCTSGTRPASPIEGQKIWQTDTKSELIYTAGAWRRTGVFDVETYGTGSISEATTLSGVANTTFAAGSPVCGVAFKAPPSGAVHVTVSGRISIASNTNEILLGWEIRTGATVGSGTITFGASSFRSVAAGRAVNAGAAGLAGASFRFPLAAGTLTPLADYNIRTMHLVTGGTGTIEYRVITVEPVL